MAGDKRDLQNSLDPERLKALPSERQRIELSTLLAKVTAADPLPTLGVDRLPRELHDEIVGSGPL